MVSRLFNRLGTGIMILTLCAFVATSSAQEEAKPKKKTKEEIAAEKKAQEEAAKKQEMVRKAKEKLNDTIWKITLTESGERANKEVINDTLRFTGMGRVESEKLVSKGFGPSNYTLRIKREDKAIWETMQAGEKGALAFWRGEIPRDQKTGNLGETMNGVLSWHISEKEKRDFTFTSTKKETITEAAKAEEAAKKAEEEAKKKAEETAKAEAAKAKEAEPAVVEEIAEEEAVVVEESAPIMEEAVVETEEVVVETPAPAKKEEPKKEEKKKNWWGR